MPDGPTDGWLPVDERSPEPAQPTPAPAAAPPVPPPIPSPPAPPAPAPYRDAGGLATALVVLAAIQVAIRALDVLAAVLQRPALDHLDNAVSVVGAPTFIALAILTPIWLARAYRNAAALTGPVDGTGSGWLAGAWFIPVVGGFLAYRPLTRVWDRTPGNGASHVAPAVWAIGWSLAWCADVAVAIAAGAKAVRLHVLDPNLTQEQRRAIVDQATQAYAPWPLFAALLVVAGSGMLVTVRRIQASQAERARAASAAWPTAPSGPS